MGRPFVLLINGDLIEGDHPGTKQLVSNHEGHHTEIAIACLEPICELAHETIITKGTECHTGDYERYIAHRLKAVNWQGTRAHDFVRIDHGGVDICATHHVGTTSRKYLEASIPWISAQNQRLESLASDWTPPDIIIYSHRHRANESRDGNSMVVVTQPWQMLTRHGNKAVPGALTQPGCAILDWDNPYRDPESKLPDVYLHNYSLPQPKPIRIKT